MDGKMVHIDYVLRALRDGLPEAAFGRRGFPIVPERDKIEKARQSLPHKLNEEGREDWAEHLLSCIVPGLNASSQSPNYYGFVTGGSTPAALFGDMLVSIYDQNVQVHLPQQSVATNVEACALNMLLDLFRLDRNTWGASPTFTTGATASNILGLAMGREWVLRRKAAVKASPLRNVGEHGVHEVMDSVGLRKVQILSTMPHSSIAKAASIVGIGRLNVVSVSRSSDLGYPSITIDFDRLEEEASKSDVANILVISTGDVNAGRFATEGEEQMRRLRAICDRNDIWMHVDGAFGIFGRILPVDDSGEFREIIQGCQGLELADSITGDGHKLLNVPYDCGFYFCRHKGIAEDVFRNGNAAYLASGASDNDIASPLHIGIENSRRFRALPVYATLLAYGRQGYIDMLIRQIRLARKVVSDLWDSKTYQVLPQSRSKLELVQKTFIVILFRARDRILNDDLVRRINEKGKIYVSGTTWDNMSAVRLAIAKADVEVVTDHKIIYDLLEKVARQQ